MELFPKLQKGKQTCHTKMSTKHSLNTRRYQVCLGEKPVIQPNSNLLLPCSCPGAEVIVELHIMYCACAMQQQLVKNERHPDESQMAESLMITSKQKR